MNLIHDENNLFVVGKHRIYKFEDDTSMKVFYEIPKDSKSTWTGVGACNGEHLFVVDSLKNLVCLSVKEAKLSSKVILEKAATSVFVEGSEIYISDKFGEVWQGKLDKMTDLDVIIGHISLLTCMLVLTDYIVTADRDEKIRITHRKRPWIIDQFLLGHKEYVSKLLFIEKENLLISAGGDEEIFVWSWNPCSFDGLSEGTDEWNQAEAKSRALIIQKLNLGIDKVNVIEMILHDGIVHVLIENTSSIKRFRIEGGELKAIENLEIEAEPICATSHNNFLFIGLVDGSLLKNGERISLIEDVFPRKTSQLRKTIRAMVE